MNSVGRVLGEEVAVLKVQRVILTVFTIFTLFLHMFRLRIRRHSRAKHRKGSPRGLERPTFHFGHGTVCKSGVAPAQHRVLSASKLIVAPYATSCSFGTCSIPKVTARVTHMVICVFHAHFTFLRCK
jgi:hypothetical protein